ARLLLFDRTDRVDEGGEFPRRQILGDDVIGVGAIEREVLLPARRIGDTGGGRGAAGAAAGPGADRARRPVDRGGDGDVGSGREGPLLRAWHRHSFIASRALTPMRGGV